MRSETTEQLWTQLAQCIAREDFGGACDLLSAMNARLRAGPESGSPAQPAEYWASLNRSLQSAMVLARAKRTHLEARFNELSETRSRRSGCAVCDAYERNR